MAFEGVRRWPGEAAIPFTTNKGYSVQTAGSNAGVWGAGNAGNDLNTGVMGIMDTNLAGVITYSLSSSNFAISATDVQSCMFRFTGALLATVTGTVAGGALFNGFYYWENVTTGSFNVQITGSVNTLVLPQSRRGILFVDGTNGMRIVAIVGSTNAQIYPAGTTQPFYQAAIPTGWSAVALNDYGMRIVTSGTTGGTTGGSGGAVAYSTANTGDYTLQIADIPPHTHSYNQGTLGGIFSGTGSQMWVQNSAPSTGSTGGGGAHHHGATTNIRTADFCIGTLG